MTFSNNGSFTLTPLSPTQEEFSKELIAYWVSFVHTGNPNTFRMPETPEWPAWINGNGISSRRRTVLRQRKGSSNEPGSFVETKLLKELDRCHKVNKMAERIRF